MIIPFVYYEGEDKWTADLHLKDQIEFAEEIHRRSKRVCEYGI